MTELERAMPGRAMASTMISATRSPITYGRSGGGWIWHVTEDNDHPLCGTPTGFSIIRSSATQVPPVVCRRCARLLRQRAEQH